jgi:hypothetical protein
MIFLVFSGFLVITVPGFAQASSTGNPDSSCPDGVHDCRVASGGYGNIPCYDVWDPAIWKEVPGGGVTYENVAATSYLGDIYLIHPGEDKRMYYQKVAGLSFDNTWTEVGGAGTTNEPLAAAEFNGKLYFFHTGEDSRIYYNTMDASNNWLSDWGWPEVGGGGTTNVAPAAAAFNNKLYVFHTGTDGRIYVNTLNADDQWGSWIEVPDPGLMVGGDDPSLREWTDDAVTTAVYNGKLYLFHIGQRGRVNFRMYVNTLNEGNYWSGWSEVPGEGLTLEPLAATPLGEKLYVFHAGTDGELYYITQDKYGNWKTPWKKIGLKYEVPITSYDNYRITDETTSQPLAAAAVIGINALWVFHTGIDEKMYYTIMSGTCGYMDIGSNRREVK